MAKKKSKEPRAVLVPVDTRKRLRREFATDVEHAAQWTLPAEGDVQAVHVRQATEDIPGRYRGLRVMASRDRNERELLSAGATFEPVCRLPIGYYYSELNLMRARCVRLGALLDLLREYPETAMARATLGAYAEIAERHLLMLVLSQSGHDDPPDDAELEIGHKQGDELQFHGRILARLVNDARGAESRSLDAAELGKRAKVLRAHRVNEQHMRALRALRHARAVGCTGEQLDALLDCSPRTRGTRMRLLHKRAPLPWTKLIGRKYFLTDAGLEGLQVIEQELREGAVHP